MIARVQLSNTTLERLEDNLINIVNRNILEFESDTKYHAMISDPPYGLAFMNKGWDSFKTPLQYQQWVTQWSTRLLNYLYPGAICAFFGGTRTYHRLATGLEDAGYEIFDSMIWCYGSGFPKSYNIGKHVKQFEGYGTALKPAYEPIVLCRKPLEKGGYVNSVLEYGTSGLNIDGSRIETNDDNRRNAKGGNNGLNGSDTFKIRERHAIDQIKHNGRFPANFGLICTCEKEPCECVESELDSQSFKMGIHSAGSKRDAIRQADKTGMFNMSGDGNRLGDSGGASRFFYTAKASSKERELGLEELELKLSGGMSGTLDQTLLTGSGNIRNNMRYNNHPTVKPIKLIEYLAKLLLPPIDNSSILIPFSGVGSEMIGAYFAGWNNITGVEIDENYVNIANKRLDYWTQFDSYSEGISNKVLIDKT